MKILLKSVCVFFMLFDSASACLSIDELKTPSSLTQQQATQLLDQWLLNPFARPVADRPRPAPTVSEIKCYLLEQSNKLPILSRVAPELERIATTILEAENAEQRGAAIIKLNDLVNRDAGTAFVLLPDESGSSVEFDLFKDFLGPSCSTVSSPNCANSYSLAAHLWWIAGYYRSIPDYYNDENIIDSLAFNERLNKKWLSYKDDTILLWPQEVLLNSLVFKQEDRGFTEPPSYKLLSLRPSIGLSYLSDEDHHIQPTLNVDLLGIYWWKYGGADGVMAQPGRGLATTLIWDGRDTALGLTYHHNPKWSATIAQGDDNDLVLSISFQLAAWFLNP